MKVLHITKYVISALMLMTISLASIAQNERYDEHVGITSFKALPFEEQRQLAYHWVNTSDSIVLPANILQEFEDHYKALELKVNYSKKYLSWLKPIYNTGLTDIDKVNFCQFVLNVFSNEELPKEMIVREKNRLINKTRD